MKNINKDNRKNKKKKIVTADDILKMESAEELGLLDKVDQVGWGGLTAKESGRIGGLMTAKKKKKALEEKSKTKEE